MIEWAYINQVKYFICILIYILEKFIFKYNYCKDIIKKLFHVELYDNINTISILYLLFNIEIHTIQNISNQIINKIIKIYYNNEMISNIYIENEINKSSENKIILSFVYLDKYHFTNILQIYNCGIVYHSTKLFTHVYNYTGDRRIEFTLI